MKRDIWSEKELRAAAGKVRESFLNSVPPPSQCQHKFSLRFRLAVQTMKDNYFKKIAHNKLISKVASIALILAISIAAFTLTNPKCMASVHAWFQEIYRDSVIYLVFSGDTEEEQSPCTNLGWLPSGYKKSDCSEFGDIKAAVYINQAGDALYFMWFQNADNALASLRQNKRHEIVSIEGGIGLFIGGGSAQNELTWVDKDENFAYTISGPLPKEDMINIAKSIF